jgi:hypothetical protein
MAIVDPTSWAPAVMGKACFGSVRLSGRSTRSMRSWRHHTRWRWANSTEMATSILLCVLHDGHRAGGLRRTAVADFRRTTLKPATGRTITTRMPLISMATAASISFSPGASRGTWWCISTGSNFLVRPNGGAAGRYFSVVRCAGGAEPMVAPAPGHFLQPA